LTPATFTQYSAISNAFVKILRQSGSRSAPRVLAFGASQALYGSLLSNSCVLSSDDREASKSLRITTPGACLANLHIFSLGLVDNFDGRRIMTLDTSNLNPTIMSLISTSWAHESAGRLVHV
jgi:hypothetical protein